MRCYKSLFNIQPEALIIQIYSVIKLYMFRATSLPIIRSFLLYIRHWWLSCRFWWPLPSRVGIELILLYLEVVIKTCMKLTNAHRLACCSCPPDLW